MPTVTLGTVPQCRPFVILGCSQALLDSIAVSTEEAVGGLGFATECARSLCGDRLRRRHPDHVLRSEGSLKTNPCIKRSKVHTGGLTLRCLVLGQTTITLRRLAPVHSDCS